VFFASFCVSEVVKAQTAATEDAATEDYEPPQFRSVTEAAAPVLEPNTAIRLAVDEDFAPYSFVSASGGPAGISVELALAACTELKVACTVTARPYGDVIPALQRGDVDVVVTGPRLAEDTLRDAAMTRPYFRIMARFAVQSGSPLKAADATSLSGRRIGVVKDTLHAQWLSAYYGSSEVVPFDTGAAAGDALRTGAVDTLFGDNLAMVYFVKGQSSANCCRLLDGAFSDFDHFSRNLAFLVRRDRPELRGAFDYGLDMAQKNGATAKIIKAYVPLNPW
jgi:polar amino acid transport system substrate-binding protein